MAFENMMPGAPVRDSTIAHREAFCLMLYENEETGRLEWLWNSRDGVTPFVISDAEGGGEMKHVDWFRDVRALFHVPSVGSRIFVDMTEARARALAARNAERWFEEDGATARERYGSAEELAKKLASSYLEPKGAPDVLIVNSAMQAEFRSRAPA
jgi:hypothetical protein